MNLELGSPAAPASKPDNSHQTKRVIPETNFSDTVKARDNNNNIKEFVYRRKGDTSCYFPPDDYPHDRLDTLPIRIGEQLSEKMK